MSNVSGIADFKASCGQDAQVRLDRLYHALTGQPPTEQWLGDAGDSGAAAARLIDTVAFRNRFRDAELSDANARMSARLWPPETRDYDLQIVIASGASWSKSEMAIDWLRARLPERMILTVLCGAPDERPFPAQPNLELHIFSGKSVFELRALLPTVLKETAWVAVLEDHVLPLEGWLDGVRRAMARFGPDDLAFTGTAANETSTAPWSWANFLFNFANHWHPSSAPTLIGTVATAVFRRDIVGAKPLPIYQYEAFVLGRSMPVYNEIRVNHTQFTSWWVATTHVFDNGQVAGSALRRISPSPRRALRRSVRYVVTRRLREMRARLACHPRSSELPRGTMVRVAWISWCHTAGSVWGCVFGGGRAHRRLE